ncbi:MAG: thioredoxin domain-containing protein [Candidatus Zixiibacteriota bacterium]|nr:MAG: thioredoxin domain-containing protein [candidate division Zixibacteria bacterium]
MPEIAVAESRDTNHLIDENSPYLLSHAHNPVDWYPWGPEALSRARELDRPIFLSIGYSACHWCHVMERESFENEEIAAILNANFVSIKVDREQRPDLDDIYMTFTTMMTGSGGWPMSVFLTPDLKPFYAGTYFPPENGYGRPGFRRLITELARIYRQGSQKVMESAESIFTEVNQRLSASLPRETLQPSMIARGAEQLMLNFDHRNGGFGPAPKFPHATDLMLLLRHYRSNGDDSYLQAVTKTLKAMADGGIRDHLGGGFARYSTDERWLVPHFEKMLYDNALLTLAYAEAYQATGEERFVETVRQTLDFVLREMRHDKGGFYSALDADSEGEEGRFYLWDASEILSTLGEEAGDFVKYYNVTAQGDFESRNILHVTAASSTVRAESDRSDFDQYLADCRAKLLEARASRIRPHTDDKILTSWNGLMLSALCRGYQVTGDERYRQAALDNAGFVRAVLFNNGRLIHAYRDGKHSKGLFLEDYAFYLGGLIDLYQIDYSDAGKGWLEMACELADTALSAFQDEYGRFYLRDEGQNDLIIRPQEETDGALPSPGSMLMLALLKLSRITGESRYEQAATEGLRAVSGLLQRNPSNMASALLALDHITSEKIEIALTGGGPDRDRMLEVINKRYLPNKIVAVNVSGDSDLPLFKGRDPIEGQVLAYVCRNSVCGLPVGTPADLESRLNAL